MNIVQLHERLNALETETMDELKARLSMNAKAREEAAKRGPDVSAQQLNTQDFIARLEKLEKENALLRAQKTPSKTGPAEPPEHPSIDLDE